MFECRGARRESESGNAPEHAALEADAANFFGCESALFAGSGFAAISLIISTLPQRNDLVLHDALIHAGLHEGMRVSRAPCQAFAHNDVNAAADAIASWRANCGRKPLRTKTGLVGLQQKDRANVLAVPDCSGSFPQ
ncbi:hypothetical protein E3U23_06620 [Erythrobacter litoralis]|uniref:hypothetical protein n=1 Tax=Erythrobacter litoralis TaxID=39960 RepID=UPI00243511E7|nr:hypothetical protein [Erythrobacter litoralis]MDG6078864.1 hypothetical protein [Erythrobacter litoralis]